MAYIDQVQVGGVTYDLHDSRLENPVFFGGVVPPAGSEPDYLNKWTNLHAAVTSDANAWVQWKIGTRGIIFKDDDQFYFYAVGTTLPSPASAYTKLLDVYPGDLIYFKGDSNPITNQQIEYVPSADNPHKHSIPALSGTAAGAGKHSHSVTAAGTLSSAGGHSHTVNNGLSISGTKGTHSHSYVKATQAETAGAHTHSVTIPTKTVDVTSTAITSGTGAGSITGSFTGSAHNHSFTPAGTLDSKGGHSHTITMASHRHEFTPVGTLSSSGSHSHTFTGTAGTTGEAGSHSHDITMASHRHSVTAAGNLSSNGAHTHSVTYSKATAAGMTSPDGHKAVVEGTVLKFTAITNSYVTGITNTATPVNTDEKGGHSHTFTGTAVNTGYVTTTGTMNAKGAHSHSFTPAGTLNSTGGHTHTFNGTLGNTGYVTSTGTMNSTGSHSHTFTGSAGTTGDKTQGGTVNITVTWPNYTGQGTIASYSVNTNEKGGHTHSLATTSATSGGTDLGLGITGTITLDSAGSHSHTFTGTAVNSSEVANHTHTVTTTASETGTGQ